MFGLKYEGAMSHFAPVRINETLTLDFDTWDRRGGDLETSAPPAAVAVAREDH